MMTTNVVYLGIILIIIYPNTNLHTVLDLAGLTSVVYLLS